MASRTRLIIDDFEKISNKKTLKISIEEELFSAQEQAYEKLFKYVQAYAFKMEMFTRKNHHKKTFKEGF